MPFSCNEDWPRLTGELAQLCWLSSFGSTALLGVFDPAEIAQVSFAQTMTTFRERHASRWWRPRWASGGSVSNDPAEWLRDRIRRGCTKFELVGNERVGQAAVPERVLVAFTGYARSHLRLHYPDRTEVWCGTWITNPNRKALIRRHVTYEGTVVTAPIVREPASIASSRSRLTKALELVTEFSQDQKVDFWLSWFVDAANRLPSAEPEMGMRYPSPISVRPYTLATRQLLAAAQAAWVFGAMGSWNDLQFTDRDVQQRYLSISDALYEAVMDAIVTGVNDVPIRNA